MAKTDDNKSPLDYIRETLANGGKDLLAVVTGALDRFSLTGENVGGFFKDYFGGETEVTKMADIRGKATQLETSKEALPQVPSQDFSALLPEGIKSITHVDLIANYGTGTEGFFDRGHEFSAPTGGPARVPAQEQSTGRASVGSALPA